MIYIKKPVVFKKESETLNAIVKDKQIQNKKRAIKALLKTHTVVNNQLIQTKNLYERQKQSFNNKHAELVSEQKIINQSLLKLYIRKCQLESFQNPQIRHKFGNSLKDYLKGWAWFNKSKFILSIRGIENYYTLKKWAHKFQTIFYIRPQIKKIVILKSMRIWMKNNIYEDVIISVKRMKTKQNTKDGYHIQVFCISGKYFYLNKNVYNISEAQLKQLIPEQNPTKNLVILPNSNQLNFLDQYFQNEGNRQKIIKLMNVYRFQIKVIKQKKKLRYFKRLAIPNIFQSIYRVPGYENLSLQVFISVKQKLLPHSNSPNNYPYPYSEYQYQYQYPNRHSHRFNRERNSKIVEQEMETKDIFYCETIQPYDSRFAFSIEDHNILNAIGGQNWDMLLEGFLGKFMVQLNVSKLAHKQFLGSKQIMKDNQYEYNARKQSQQLEQQIEQRHHRKQKPRIVPIIDFTSKQNTQKIITAQSAIKMYLAKKLYKSQLEISKKSLKFHFSCKIFGNIIISAFINKQQIIFFVECLSLSAQKTNQDKDNFLHYPKKYWILVQQFMESQQFDRIIRKYLVWEIEDEIDHFFQEAIRIYEQKQLLLNQMKPIKAINRLRRFLIKTILKKKINKNILHIGKLQKQFGQFVIIIRRSSFFKNIANVYLYPLKIINKNKQLTKNKEIFKKILDENYKFRQDSQTELKQSEDKKLKDQNDNGIKDGKFKYQPISIFLQNALLFVNNFANRNGKNFIKGHNKIKGKSIQKQFHITEGYFLLKPLHIQYLTGQYIFVQRLSSVCLSSQQIINEIQNLSYLKNSNENLSQQQFRRTLVPHYKSFIRPNNKLNASIIFDRNCYNSNSNNISNNNSIVHGQSSLSQEQNTIFFSLYKDRKQAFFLQLFIIIQGRDSECTHCFKSVHREELSKKDVSSSGWSFVYRLIAYWVKNSNWCVNSCKKNAHDRANQLLNYYLQGSNQIVANDRQEIQGNQGQLVGDS